MKVTREGSIVRATSVKIDDGLVPHRLVMRHVPDSVQPWTTHEETMTLSPDETSEDGAMLVHRSFYWGHYFDTEAEAVADFDKRKESFR